MFTDEELRRIGAVYGVDVGPMLRERAAARADGLTDGQREAVRHLAYIADTYGINLSAEAARQLLAEQFATEAEG